MLQPRACTKDEASRVGSVASTTSEYRRTVTSRPPADQPGALPHFGSSTGRCTPPAEEVHRRWGTIAAVADGRHPVGVILSDGDKAWFATAPGAANDQDLTPEQVEHIMLDALAADSRPQWPDWHPLL